jgi:SpoIVB peptidase S55
VFACVITILLAAASFGQMPAAKAAPGGTAIYSLSDVKEGDRGVARTVFHGSVPEEFNVEILGVVPGAIGPHQDMIIGRLSGTNAERTFVFAGMSGSPVYIGGKLVGAISYSFPFSKEPICGITPIEQMISIFEQAPAATPASAGTHAFTRAELAADIWRAEAVNGVGVQGTLVSGMPQDSRLAAVAGQTFVPIATPMTFSGVSQSTLDRFAPELSRGGILPVAAAGATSRITPMEPFNETTLLGGTSIVVNLARGDVSVAAAGTVTLRDGAKIYAFGHPYFSLGTADLPMSESHVVTVVPNTNNSFKLAVPDAMVGAMTQDRSTGIYGSLGRSPKMIPVHVNMTTSRGRAEKIDFESAVDDYLTPLIISVGIQNSLSANERGIGDTTIDLSTEIKVAGENSVRIDRRFAGAQAAAYAASSPAVPVGLLLKSNFDGLQITGINVDIKVSDGARTAVLERLTTDRTQVRPGETVQLTAYSRSESGAVMTQRIPLTIPAGAAPGALSITVADGNALQEKSASQQFVPKTASELIATLNSIKRSDRLYAVATRTSAGAIIGSSEMPNLPPSVLATLNSDRSAGGSKPSVQTVIVDQSVTPIDHLVTGQQTLTLEIIR